MNPKPSGFHRLHALRMENDETRFAMDEMRPRFEALRTRHEDGTAPRAVAVHQLFQTPPGLAARLVELADIRQGHSVLEPSAGLGRLLDAIDPKHAGRTVAVELDPRLAGELFEKFRGVELKQGDFLARHFGMFDRIVMNPPFTMRSDIRHIIHALDHLEPGGVLAGLCLATRHRVDALRHLASHWEEIPAGAFKAEGTRVDTYLFRITK